MCRLGFRIVRDIIFDGIDSFVRFEYWWRFDDIFEFIVLDQKFGGGGGGGL